MRIIQHIKNEWFRYGFETLAVIVGILAAFALDNWNDERKDRQFEKKLLVDLQADITNDFRLVEMSINGNERSRHACESILSHMARDLPYHDSLALLFETSNIWWKLLIRTHAYSNAKSYGLDFIRDDSTRVLLSSLYEQELSFAETLDERQALYYYHTVAPILTNLFESIDRSWHVADTGNVPHDYEALKKNERYKSILRTNIGDRKHYVEFTRMIQRHMQELEVRIRTEIETF